MFTTMTSSTLSKGFRIALSLLSIGSILQRAKVTQDDTAPIAFLSVDGGMAPCARVSLDLQHYLDTPRPHFEKDGVAVASKRISSKANHRTCRQRDNRLNPLAIDAPKPLDFSSPARHEPRSN